MNRPERMLSNIPCLPCASFVRRLVRCGKIFTWSQATHLFLFCGRRCDRIKALHFEKDGFCLLYKRLDNGRFQWPRNSSEVRNLTRQEYRWLLEGLSIDQPKAIRPAREEWILIFVQKGENFPLSYGAPKTLLATYPQVPGTDTVSWG